MTTQPGRRKQLKRGRLLAESLLLVRALMRHWARAEELAEETGLHRRTVYRALATFRATRALGLRLAREHEGPEVYWHLPAAGWRRWLRAR